MEHIDVERLKKIAAENVRYERQLARLKDLGKQISCISAAVNRSIDNIRNNERAFVIYGEPQSGKTEMMICLTAKLIDSGFNVVVHLLNDSVQLLRQNLDRFQRSRLSPSAKNFSEVMDPDISLSTGQHVIFCKKNGSDLKKLNEKLASIDSIVVIDDEADFATPNSKVNKGGETPIHSLIKKLIGESGIYIGVTATPARLDLNNTFDNNNEIWVNFPPHDAYTGQDVFFPIDHSPDHYNLTLLPDTKDDPRFLREAVFRFLIRVAKANLKLQRDENWSMLIHTSGNKINHKADRKPIEDVFQSLADPASSQFTKVLREIRKIAETICDAAEVDKVLDYIAANRSVYSITTMNSDRDKNVDFTSATDPSALFTFVIGGNIVSRGVTFNNLLSMFFTRDSKHKIQQDTYIQRARMFGSRKEYLAHFELTIPNQLYVDWHRCFVFHKLALEAIKAGLGSPVWLGDNRINPVSSSSVDQANVSLDRGEMSFRIFDYDSSFEDLCSETGNPIDVLKKLQSRIGKEALPDYVIRYVVETSKPNGKEIGIHSPTDISGYSDADGLDKTKIERRRGFFGKSQREKFKDAIHHFAIFHNGKGRARIIYRFVGNISFIKNLKHV